MGRHRERHELSNAEEIYRQWIVGEIPPGTRVTRTDVPQMLGRVRITGKTMGEQGIYVGGDFVAVTDLTGQMPGEEDTWPMNKVQKVNPFCK